MMRQWTEDRGRNVAKAETLKGAQRQMAAEGEFAEVSEVLGQGAVAIHGGAEYGMKGKF